MSSNFKFIEYIYSFDYPKILIKDFFNVKFILN